MSHPTRLRRLAGASLLVAVLGVLAASCGGSTDETAPPTSQGVSATDQVLAVDEKPTPGGQITYGLEAESDGFNPVSNRWAISGTMVGLAVYDPLAAYDADGQVQPYLAASIEPNDDYTIWTITLRPGVTFHDGTPLTADAVRQVLEGHLASALTKPVFAPVEALRVDDDLTLTVVMESPWVAFPSALTSQAGVVPEPSTLTGDGSQPVGTGPFEQVSWERNQAWTGKKYGGYWRTDEDGQQLPYLDTVVFRPIAEPDVRDAALETGEIQMAHTTTARSVARLRTLAGEGKIQLVEDRGEGEEGFIILNTAKEPLNDKRIRRALAHATNTEQYNQLVNEGVFEIAEGPFKENSPWYAETEGYPTYDVAQATTLVEEWKAENGGQAPEVTISFDTDNIRNAELLKEQWQAAGFVVNTEQVDQAKLILNVVSGEYEANIWRQFGAVDPDFDYIWWHSSNAGDGPSGGLTLNIARNKSECVDAALAKGRENAELEVRKQAYAELQQCFADEVPYIWTNHTVWAVGATLDVRGITNGPLPDGQPSLPIGGAGDFGGVTRLTQTWLAS